MYPADPDFVSVCHKLTCVFLPRQATKQSFLTEKLVGRTDMRSNTSHAGTCRLESLTSSTATAPAAAAAGPSSSLATLARRHDTASRRISTTGSGTTNIRPYVVECCRRQPVGDKSNAAALEVGFCRRPDAEAERGRGTRPLGGSPTKESRSRNEITPLCSSSSCCL